MWCVDFLCGKKEGGGCERGWSHAGSYTSFSSHRAWTPWSQVFWFMYGKRVMVLGFSNENDQLLWMVNLEFCQLKNIFFCTFSDPVSPLYTQ